MSYAQTVNYEQRYEMLVSRFGPAGVGIETLLDNWAKADSTDEKLLAARFDYYLVKSRSNEIVKKSTKKYLGMDPLLSLKDTLGADVYYYQDVVYDDELFGKAIHAADRAISLYWATITAPKTLKEFAPPTCLRCYSQQA